jgi:hypothetical protein
MKTNISPVPDQGMDQSRGSEKMIREIIGSLQECSNVNAVACLESMLFEWYQYYAPAHYDDDHIHEVVNTTFRVNELLLKLQDLLPSAGNGPAQESIDRIRVTQAAY